MCHNKKKKLIERGGAKLKKKLIECHVFFEFTFSAHYSYIINNLNVKQDSPSQMLSVLHAARQRMKISDSLCIISPSDRLFVYFLSPPNSQIE